MQEAKQSEHTLKPQGIGFLKVDLLVGRDTERKRVFFGGLEEAPMVSISKQNTLALLSCPKPKNDSGGLKLALTLTWHL